MNILNQLVEQVAIEQVDKAILRVESLYESLIKTSQAAREVSNGLRVPTVNYVDTNNKLKESDAIVVKLRKTIKDLEDGYDRLQKKLDTLTAAKVRNTRAVTDNSVNQSILLRNVKEEEVLQSSLTTYISKLSVERIRAGRVVADYNAQIALGNKLTKEQQAELDAATAKFQKYDNAIKAGKKSIGDSREYVGAYERANYGLTNSISQIARELPAATYGFQTFAVAISNNIPMAVDEINKAVKVNKELSAQGKETTSVWKRVGSAFTSFNVIMSASILLFTLAAPKIEQWAKSMFGVSDALNEAKKGQEELNKAQQEGQKAVVGDQLQLKSWLAIAKDSKLTDEERMIAVKKLRGEYAYYFKDLSDNEILAGKVASAEKGITAALNAKGEAEKANAQIIKNNQRLIEIEREVAAQKKLQDQAEKTARSLAQGGASSYSVAGSGEQSARVAVKINELNKERNILLDQNAKNADKILQLQKDSIALEYQEEKAGKAAVFRLRERKNANEDYLASEYELRRLRLQNQTNLNREIMDDEATGYDLRLAASEQYYQNLLDLANMEAKEETRLLNNSTDEKLRQAVYEYSEQKSKLDDFLKDGKISRAAYNTEISDAEKTLQDQRTGILYDAANKQNIIYENQAQRLINANKELVGQMQRAWDELNFGKADNEIAQIELDNVQKISQALKEIPIDGTPEEIQAALSKINDLAQGTANDIDRREAQLALDRAERTRQRIIDETVAAGIAKGLSKDQINASVQNNLAILEAERNVIKAKKAVEDADNKSTRTQIENNKKLKEEKRQAFEETLDAARETFSRISDLANLMFNNQIGNYDREIEKSNEYYDRLIENAEDGSEQELALQEEKQRKEQDLQMRKVEAQRKAAIFNKFLGLLDIGINLRKEISGIRATAALLPPGIKEGYLAVNIPLAIAAAGANAIAIAATPLPQYEKGRVGGKAEIAMINEKRIEPVESEDGTVRIYSGKNRIVPLAKGDTVHRSVEEFANGWPALQRASIMASFANSANKALAFDRMMLHSLHGTIEKGIEKGFKKAKITNYNKMGDVVITMPRKGNFSN